MYCQLIIIVIVIFVFKDNLGEEKTNVEDVAKYITHIRDNVNASIDSKLTIAYGNINTTKAEFEIQIQIIKEEIENSVAECAESIKEILRELEEQLITLENCAMKKEFEEERCSALGYFNVILEKAKGYSDICKETHGGVDEKSDRLEKDLQLARKRATQEINKIVQDSKDCIETTTDIIKKGIDDVMIGWEACKE